MTAARGSGKSGAAGRHGAGKKKSEAIPVRQRGAAAAPPQKRYLKNRPVCKVTFRLPAAAAAGARQVCLAGDFNGWAPGDAVMRRLKSGEFTLTVDLETGRDHRFRYLIDGERWENDWCADRYEPNVHGSEDSVVCLCGECGEAAP